VSPADRADEMAIENVCGERRFRVTEDIKSLLLLEAITQVARRQDFLHRKGEMNRGANEIDPCGCWWIGVRGVQHLAVGKAEERPAGPRLNVDGI
jgi:hypothetical protein